MNETFLTKIQVDSLVRLIKKVSESFLPLVKKKWQTLGHEQIGLIVKDEMSGRPGLNRRSGNAARALSPITEIQGLDVTTKWVAGGPAAKYLPVHQYGAIIKPINGAYLRFQIKGGVYASSLKTKQVKKVKTLSNWVTVKQIVIPKRLHIIERFENPGTKLRAEAVIQAMEELSKNGSH